ncbi:MAG: PEGA domain-containing protein, partial [Deltaproteobacteria bacterium]
HDAAPQGADAGKVTGAALGALDAPVKPEVALYELHVDSVPRGAAVRVGGRSFGETPSILALPAGQHTLTLNLEGYEPEAVIVQIRDGARAASLRRTVYLSRKAAPPTRKWTPRSEDEDERKTPPRDTTKTTPKTTTTTPKTTTVDTTPKADDEQRKPRIDLLDELEPAPKKKPTVELLDGDDGKKKPKVDLLGP